MSELQHVVVLDFEATCDDQHPPVPQEIIELPSVLLSLRTLEVLDEHEAFVRPRCHPTLTSFCKSLTGIEQSDVDGASLFPEAFEAHLTWLARHGLTGDDFAIVTCGDWDLRTMLPAQLAACAPPIDYVPLPYRRWINVKVPFKKWNPKRTAGGMLHMLETLGIPFEGRHHRGIDDCRNIAKIVRALVTRHQTLAITSELPASRYPTIKLTLTSDDDARSIELRVRTLGSLLGVASDAFRREVTHAFLDDLELTSDGMLCELRSGELLRVTFKGDGPRSP